MELPFEFPALPVDTSNLAYIVFLSCIVVAVGLGIIIAAKATSGGKVAKAKIMIVQKRNEIYFLLKEKKVSVTKKDFTWAKQAFTLELEYTAYLNGGNPVIFYDFDKVRPIPFDLSKSVLHTTSSAFHLFVARRFIKDALDAAKGMSWQLVPMLISAVMGISIGILVGMYMPTPTPVTPPINATEPITPPQVTLP